jgi:hypothetical protein
MILILDPEEKSNYDFSISNLIMLKLFFDAGVNVSDFSDFTMDYNYGPDSSSDILIDGLKALYSDVVVLCAYEDSEQLSEVVSNTSINSPETLLIIKDEQMDKLFHSRYYQEFCEQGLKPNCSGDFCEFEIESVPHYGLLICVYWDGMHHEIVENIIAIKKWIEEYSTKLEG